MCWLLALLRTPLLHGTSAELTCRPPPPGKLLAQSVDFFRSFWDDPYLLGRVRQSFSAFVLLLRDYHHDWKHMFAWAVHYSPLPSLLSFHASSAPFSMCSQYSV